MLWHNQNPAIYFHRSDKIITLDNSGKCISLDRVINPDEMYILHWLDGTSKTINGIQYKLERDIPIGNSYGRLCIVGADGNTSIIYDATKAENTSKILSICGVASFTGVVITLFVRKLKKEKPWENHYKALWKKQDRGTVLCPDRKYRGWGMIDSFEFIADLYGKVNPAHRSYLPYADILARIYLYMTRILVGR